MGFHNHSDRFRPLIDRVVEPFPNGLFYGLLNGGYSPLTSPEMIQVLLPKGNLFGPSWTSWEKNLGSRKPDCDCCRVDEVKI